MANIKSAKKRVEVAAIRTERNKAIRSKVKTYIKKVEKAVAEGNKEEATAVLPETIKQIEMAASKGIYHDNNAARKVARVTKLVNSLN